MKKTGQKFLYLSKLSSTEFNSESNSNFLNGKSRPETLKSSQTSLNGILFGIKLKISELNRQAGNSYISASSRIPQRNSIWNRIETFWIKKAGQKFLCLSKPSATEFDLESTSNFLNGKSRPESPIYAFHTLPKTTTSKISVVWGRNYNDLRYVKISCLVGRISLKSKTLYQSENLKCLLPNFLIERCEVLSAAK